MSKKEVQNILLRIDVHVLNLVLKQLKFLLVHIVLFLQSEE